MLTAHAVRRSSDGLESNPSLVLLAHSVSCGVSLAVRTPQLTLWASKTGRGAKLCI